MFDNAKNLVDLSLLVIIAHCIHVSLQIIFMDFLNAADISLNSRHQARCSFNEHQRTMSTPRSVCSNACQT